MRGKIKINYPSILVLAFVLTATLLGLDGYALGSGGSAAQGSMEMVLTSAYYVIYDEENGHYRVEMDGFKNIGEPGEPNLPVRSYRFVLPPDADLSSVNVEILESHGRKLDGSYDIEPGGPFCLVSDPETLDWGAGKDIVDGKDMNVYGKDALYPAQVAGLYDTAQMRKWKFALIKFSPFQYNPKEKSLVLHQSVKIRISYETGKPVSEALLKDTVFDNYAEELFDNYVTAKTQYTPAPSMAMASYPEMEYVICTSNAVADSGILGSFISHKQNIGFSIGVWKGSDPRSWLRSNYASMGIRYVLIVADVGTITAGSGIHADIRYVDLNDDGKIRAPELFVGRIETDETATITSILNKVINYETATTDIDYRKKFYFADDLGTSSGSDKTGVPGVLGDTFIQQIADPAGFTSKGAGMVTGGWLAGEWAGNPCGSLFMRGHGRKDSTMSSKFGYGSAAALDDSRPGIPFLVTCCAGEWGQLVWAMLKNGCIACMANNNFTWAHIGYKSKSWEVGAADSFGYLALYRLMVEKAPTGDAFHMGRFVHGSDTAYNSDFSWNYWSYHLKGDPSVQLLLPEDLSGNPVITSYWMNWAKAGRAYKEKLVVRGGKRPYTWAIAGGSLPSGLSLNPDSGEITGTSSTEQSSTFIVKVTDADGKSATKELWIDVADYGEITGSKPAPELKIVTSRLPDATAGKFYAYTLVAQPVWIHQYGSDDCGEHFHWTVESGSLPGGMIIRELGGCIRGTASAPGTYTFTIKAIGGDPGLGPTYKSEREVTRQFTLEVREDSGPSPLEILTTSLPGGTIDQPYGAFLAAQGGMPPYSWSVVSGSLPPGVNLSADGGLTGTASAAGDFGFTVRVTDDAGATDTKNLSISISDGPPPPVAITTESLPKGVVGVAYSMMLEAVGGVPPYDWIVTAGSLPEGILLSHDGICSGSPTAEGIYTFTVQVGGGSGDVDTKEFTIEILPPGSLAITTGSLPAGEVGTAYWANVEAVGGIPPHTWSITGGSLPPGLGLEAAAGTISGTPGSTGTYLFTMRVEDRAGEFAARQFSIEVNLKSAQDPAGPSVPVIQKNRKKGGGCAMTIEPSDPGSAQGVMLPYVIIILALMTAATLKRKKRVVVEILK